MALDGCGQLCKYVLIIFNIFFAVVGFAMLALGLWLRFSNDTRGFFEIDMLNTSAFVIGVTVLISLGSVMLVVVAFGDFGACNENRCALQVFAVLLGVMAGIEVALGVLAYSRSDEVGAQLSEFYSSMYTLYVANKDPASAVTLTLFHNAFHCCGVVGVMLDVVKQTCPKPSGIWETFTMPACPAVIASAFRSKAPVILAIFLVTGALLTVALICALILNSKLRDSLSAAQYIILSQSSPTVVANDNNNPQALFQSTLVYSASYPSSSSTYDQPVVFAPLPTLVNVPVDEAQE